MIISTLDTKQHSQSVVSAEPTVEILSRFKLAFIHIPQSINYYTFTNQSDNGI